jgi:hypothetical protein
MTRLRLTRILVVGLLAGVSFAPPAAASVLQRGLAPPTYSLVASTTSIGPGESVTFTTDAPGDQYAQLMITAPEFVGGGGPDGAPGPVLYGPVSIVVGTVSWDDYSYLNWYTCEGGRMAVVIYSGTVGSLPFIGSLWYGQSIGGVAPIAEVFVDLEGDPSRCAAPPTSSPGSPTTSPGSSLPSGPTASDAVGSLDSERLPATGRPWSDYGVAAGVITMLGVGVLVVGRRPRTT